MNITMKYGTVIIKMLVINGLFIEIINSAGKPTLSNLDISDGCSRGSIINGLCYFLTEKPSTYYGSRRQCQIEGGTLATLRQKSTLKWIQEHLKTKGDILIGLERNAKVNSFSWIYDTCLKTKCVKETFDTEYWSFGRSVMEKVSRMQSTSRCVALKSDFSRAEARPCRSRHFALCEKDIKDTSYTFNKPTSDWLNGLDEKKEELVEKLRKSPMKRILELNSELVSKGEVFQGDIKLAGQKKKIAIRGGDPSTSSRYRYVSPLKTPNPTDIEYLKSLVEVTEKGTYKGEERTKKKNENDDVKVKNEEQKARGKNEQNSENEEKNKKTVNDRKIITNKQHEVKNDGDRIAQHNETQGAYNLHENKGEELNTKETVDNDITEGLAENKDVREPKSLLINDTDDIYFSEPINLQPKSKKPSNFELRSKIKSDFQKRLHDIMQHVGRDGGDNLENIFHQWHTDYVQSLEKLFKQNEIELEEESKANLFTRSHFEDKSHSRSKRGAIKYVDHNPYWDGGKVPYTFYSAMAENIKFVIRGVMDQFTSQTGNCIRFTERTNENDYVLIKDNEAGCFSEVGRSDNGGQTIVNIHRNCLYFLDSSRPVNGTVLHELMHAVGFYHEHSRPDRDNYVRVLKENVLDGTQLQFAIKQNSLTNGFEYDYTSVMHYILTAFAKTPWVQTLEVLRPDLVPENFVIGNTEYLSATDVLEIRRLYGCGDIRTFGGNAKGKFCHFPFNFNGSDHQNCVLDLGSKEPLHWCSVKKDTSVFDIEWGYCFFGSAENYTSITTTAGERCHFPFYYQDRRFEFCTSYDRSSMWCSTTEVYDGKWGTCALPYGGAWSNWSQWSSCDKTCNGGQRLRTRRCDNPIPRNGGPECAGTGLEHGSCFSIPCPDTIGLEYYWIGCYKDDAWPPIFLSLESSFGDDFKSRSNKSKKCIQAASLEKFNTIGFRAGGMCLAQNSSRQSLLEITPSTECEKEGYGSDYAMDAYALDKDLIGPSWTSWTMLTDCSVTCGGGIRSRSRLCWTPTYLKFEKNCSGAATQEEACSINQCPIDGQWGTWSEWTSCLENVVYRSRLCNNPPPSLGGSQCLGEPTQAKTC